MGMKTMILLSAIPGSGKSTWAKRFQAKHPNTHIISSDELRLELYGAVNNFQHEKEIWDTFVKRLNELSTQDDVFAIADATNLKNIHRAFYARSTPNFDRHILLIFQVDPELCKKQNKMRDGDRVVPDYAMERLIAEYQEPNDEVKSLYDKIIYIHEDQLYGDNPEDIDL